MGKGYNIKKVFVVTICQSLINLTGNCREVIFAGGNMLQWLLFRS